MGQKLVVVVVEKEVGEQEEGERIMMEILGPKTNYGEDILSGRLLICK